MEMYLKTYAELKIIAKDPKASAQDRIRAMKLIRELEEAHCPVFGLDKIE